MSEENRRFQGTGGRSQENRSLGFRPAFFDGITGIIYASRFSNGMDAPFHLLDGLPDEVVMRRHASGQVAEVKTSLVSGFLRDGLFYTREQAAAFVAGA
uniref:Uncharacterized protein n=1 Tax=Aromatoleum toluolicum TaxID=90060 RepID=A0ABX1NHX3_9RHOO|nr:hypothetical protein [Aromatoleum toluolicum]